MTRFRRVPTPITSARALVAALEANGFKIVERHSAPQPLLSWRKQPLGVEAEIIVRQAQIGSTADDLGFSRGPGGAFEAIVSEIHFSRFDGRWFQKLIQRAEVLGATLGESPNAPQTQQQTRSSAQHSEPASTKPEFASSPRRPTREIERPSRPEPERRELQPNPVLSAALEDVLQEFGGVQEAPVEAKPDRSDPLDPERELLTVLSAARKASGSLGCGPVVFGWLLVSAIALSNRSGSLVFFATVIAFVLFTRAAKRRTERMVSAGAAEFAARFRGEPKMREVALRKLRAGLATQSAELKPVVEGMLRRLGG